MNTSTKTLQLVLAACGLLVAIATGLRWYDWTSSPHGPQLRVSPAAGPVGTRPIVEVFNFKVSPITVEFCDGNSSDAACVTMASMEQPAKGQVNAIPAEVGSEQVEPGRWYIRATSGEETVFAPFTVVEFGMAEIEFAKFGGLETLSFSDPVTLLDSAPCPPSVTPDGRVRIGRAVVDPVSSVVVEMPFDGEEVAWAPNGSRVAIISSDKKDLRIALPNGDDQESVVTEARGFLRSLSWSRDASEIAYVAYPDTSVRGGPQEPTVRTYSLVSGTTNTHGRGDRVVWTDKGLLIEESGRVRLGDTELGAGTNPAVSWDQSLIGWIVEGRPMIRELDSGSTATTRATGLCGFAFMPKADGIIATASDGKLQLIRLTG